jgi:hypothetical protein
MRRDCCSLLANNTDEPLLGTSKLLPNRQYTPSWIVELDPKLSLSELQTIRDEVTSTLCMQETMQTAGEVLEGAASGESVAEKDGKNPESLASGGDTAVLPSINPMDAPC